jgi:hypothetical protein
VVEEGVDAVVEEGVDAVVEEGDVRAEEDGTGFAGEREDDDWVEGVIDTRGVDVGMGNVGGLLVVLDCVVEDLDRGRVDISDVETREMVGLALIVRGVCRRRSIWRCAARMVSCMAAMFSCSFCRSDDADVGIGGAGMAGARCLGLATDEPRDDAVDTLRFQESNWISCLAAGGKLACIIRFHLRTMLSTCSARCR